MTWTEDEQRLGVAIRIDPVHRVIDSLDGITTYLHRSLHGDHTFQGWLEDGPEKVIPNPLRPDRTITIGGLPSPPAMEGIRGSRVYCEGCGMLVGSVYVLDTDG